MENAEIDLLIDYYARESITLTSVSLEERQAGMQHFGGHTGLYQGFIFPLAGKAKMWFDGTEYELERGMVVHTGPHMQLDRKVIGEKQWAYILVLYRVDQERGRGTSDCAKKHYGLRLVEQGGRLQEKPGCWNTFGTYLETCTSYE